MASVSRLPKVTLASTSRWRVDRVKVADGGWVVVTLDVLLVGSCSSQLTSAAQWCHHLIRVRRCGTATSSTGSSRHVQTSACTVSVGIKTSTLPFCTANLIVILFSVRPSHSMTVNVKLILLPHSFRRKIAVLTRTRPISAAYLAGRQLRKFF